MIDQEEMPEKPDTSKANQSDTATLLIVAGIATMCYRYPYPTVYLGSLVIAVWHIFDRIQSR